MGVMNKSRWEDVKKDFHFIDNVLVYISELNAIITSVTLNISPDDDDDDDERNYEISAGTSDCWSCPASD